MTSERKKVPQSVKRTLRNQTGGKCANPGCMNRRIQEHHIKHWAVFQTHDEKDMVAVCPACHDAIHHGDIQIDDDTIRRWKSIKRYPVRRDVLAVEPGKTPSLLLGSHLVGSPSGCVTVFSLSEQSRLVYYTDPDDFYLIDCRLATADGRELLRIKDNRITHQTDTSIKYSRIPGRFKITAPRTPNIIPNWLEGKLQAQIDRFPHLLSDETGDVTLMDLEVTRPSQVRAIFTCVDGRRAIVARHDAIFVCTPKVVTSFSGAGTFILNDTIALFGVGRGSGMLAAFSENDDDFA